MHNGNQSGASICDAAAHKLSAAGSKLWGDSLSGDECGTQWVGKDRPWGRRNVPLVDVFIKTEICLCILKCYFSQKFISDPDKQDLFIYFMAITGLLRAACSGRFSPQKRLFRWAFQGFASKNSELQKPFLNVEIFSLGWFFFLFFLFLRPKLHLSNPQKRKDFFSGSRTAKNILFSSGCCRAGAPWVPPTPGMPLRAAASIWHTRFTEQTQPWPCKVGETQRKLLCVRFPQLFRGDTQLCSGSPASP